MLYLLIGEQHLIWLFFGGYMLCLLIGEHNFNFDCFIYIYILYLLIGEHNFNFDCFFVDICYTYWLVNITSILIVFL